MEKLNLHITGIPCLIEVQNTPGSDQLLDELKLYPITDHEPEVVISYLTYDEFIRLHEANEGTYLVFTFKNSKVVLSTEKKPAQAFFCIVPHKNLLFKLMQKITSNQYTIREEYVGQIFHENVIIPLLGRMDDILLIHGAAFNLNEKTILIGGRGGVGKTSIALRACFHKSGSFITDDMAIIRSHCIYPNLNFPKIYQYNLVGEPQLQKRLMGSFSILRKIHWLLYSPLFRKPPRIRVRPDRIFDVGKAAKIDIYFIIERTNQINLFEYQKLNSTEAAGISAVIMQEELGQFKLEDHFSERYVTQFKAQLSKTEIYLVKVSDSMSHQKYLNHMESLILRLTKTKN